MGCNEWDVASARISRGGKHSSTNELLESYLNFSSLWPLNGNYFWQWQFSSSIFIGFYSFILTKKMSLNCFKSKPNIFPSIPHIFSFMKIFVASLMSTHFYSAPARFMEKSNNAKIKYNSKYTSIKLSIKCSYAMSKRNCTHNQS